ncbi:MAG: helix-turn-helix transcriptional regulator, partial [Chloroflexota bacterium]|nr:helix-turn-helix transcriptional regulator [Chloroflexota bacterium]
DALAAAIANSELAAERRDDKDIETLARDFLCDIRHARWAAHDDDEWQAREARGEDARWQEVYRAVSDVFAEGFGCRAAGDDAVQVAVEQGLVQWLDIDGQPQSVAEQIRDLRQRREWTQAKLAQQSGKTQETISQLERDDYDRYTVQTLRRLADAFGVALIVQFTSLNPNAPAAPEGDGA